MSPTELSGELRLGLSLLGLVLLSAGEARRGQVLVGLESHDNRCSQTINPVSHGNRVTVATELRRHMENGVPWDPHIFSLPHSNTQGHNATQHTTRYTVNHTQHNTGLEEHAHSAVASNDANMKSHTGN